MLFEDRIRLQTRLLPSVLSVTFIYHLSDVKYEGGMKTLNKSSVVLYKTLVIGVIILFCGIAVSPSIIADDEARDSPKEIQEYDDYKEFFTLISVGSAEIKWLNKTGIFSYEVEIINYPETSGIRLQGLKMDSFFLILKNLMNVQSMFMLNVS